MPVDADRLEASQGWTIEQALERTADPQLWDGWIAAKAVFDKINASSRSPGGAAVHQSDEKIHAQRDAVAAAFGKLDAQLREQLLRGMLRAAGCRGSPGVFPASIERAAWSRLRLVDLQHSIVQECGERAVTIHNVRIFPLVHFDESIAEVTGCSLAEAFRRFVLEDPEVVSSQKRIPEWKRYEEVFVEGQMPGPVVSFLWPVEVTGDDLAYDFVRSIFIDLYSDLPKPSATIRHVAEVIVDRWQRLRQRLIAGEILARGTFARTGMVQYLDPLQWARQGLSVDVKSGDLIEFEDRKPIVRWSGLSLSSPRSVQTIHASNFADRQDAAVGVRGRRSGGPDERQVISAVSKGPGKHRRRPIADAVARALKAHALDQSRGEYSLKQIASIIAPSMPKPPKTEAEMLALAKAVKRYYEELVVQRA